MINLKDRSDEPELLDGDDIPFADIQQNMKELNTINTLLGGHKITVDGFKKLCKKGRSVIVCEIGCGGGDNLAVIHKYCKENSIQASFIGIDIKETCIEFAKNQYPDLPCQWIIGDYQSASLTENPDIIFSSLFCHHFTEEQLITMLQWMKANSSLGFFINDLERNKIAYYCIKILTSIFSSSYLVKNDAPLSVARGFKKKEWINLLNKAGLENYTVQWKWAFRHLICYRH